VAFFGISLKEAAQMDPQQRVFPEMASEAAMAGSPSSAANASATTPGAPMPPDGSIRSTTTPLSVYLMLLP
jgi:hypothetical protein